MLSPLALFLFSKNKMLVWNPSGFSFSVFWQYPLGLISNMGWQKRVAHIKLDILPETYIVCPGGITLNKTCLIQKFIKLIFCGLFSEGIYHSLTFQIFLFFLKRHKSWRPGDTAIISLICQTLLFRTTTNNNNHSHQLFKNVNL